MGSEFACAPGRAAACSRDGVKRGVIASRLNERLREPGRTGRFRRADRLTRRDEFEAVYERGRKFQTRQFVAFVLFKEEGALRVGVVASRRVGDAVRRNRAKRRLREVFRRNRAGLEGVSADVVLVARAGVGDASYGDLERAYVTTVLRALEGARRRA